MLPGRAGESVVFCFFQVPYPGFPTIVRLFRTGSGINDSREPEAMSLLSKKSKGALRKDSVHIGLQRATHLQKTHLQETQGTGII